MKRNDLDKLGALMDESHRSLSEDYEVSSDGLDLVSQIARSHAGTIGARMTGGGFGGAAVALVHDDQADAVAAMVIERYRQETGLTSNVWSVEPSAGASARASEQQSN